MNVVELIDVHKVYENRVHAVKGVTLTVKEGEIYGLIGPNGAGKTTLLRMIVGLVKPSKGVVRVMGQDPYRDFDATRAFISYLPEDANTYPLLTGLEHLYFYAKIYGAVNADEMVKYGAEISGLGKRLNDLTLRYSHGMRRRLLLAVALMRKPKIAVLDEPTSGLDVHASVSVRNMIKKYVAETRATVIVSSHNMLEIEYLCDRVGLIHNGVLIAEDEPRKLMRDHNASNLEEVFTKLVGER